MRIDRHVLVAAVLGVGAITVPASASTTLSVPGSVGASDTRAPSTYERIALGNANQPSRSHPQYGQTTGGPRGRHRRGHR